MNSPSGTPTRPLPQTGESETTRFSRHPRVRRGGSREQGSERAYNAQGSFPVRPKTKVLGSHQRKTSRNTSDRGGRGRKDRENGKEGALTGAPTCAGLTALTCTDRNAVRIKSQIGTACAPTHVPQSAFRLHSVAAGPFAGRQIQELAIRRQCHFLVAHLSLICTRPRTFSTQPRGGKSEARF